MRIYAFISLTIFYYSVKAQELPFLSQKLTNSFLYNPAITGQSSGSFSFSHRKNFSQVQGGPITNYFNISYPVFHHNIGLGVNAYQEKISFLENNFFSTSFAWHKWLNPQSQFSLGISAELSQLRYTSESNTISTEIDPVLFSYQQGGYTPDFSFGGTYQNSYVKFGISANRIAYLLRSEWSKMAPSATFFLEAKIPTKSKSLKFEPYISVRQMNPKSYSWDAACFVSYSNKLTLGLGLRNSQILVLSIGLKLGTKGLVGYSYEINNGALRGYLGTSQEFVGRVDFKQQKPTTYYKQYRAAVSHRRKILTTQIIKRASFSSKKVKHVYRKLKANSPNKRYQNASQLNKKKLSQTKKHKRHLKHRQKMNQKRIKRAQRGMWGK